MNATETYIELLSGFVEKLKAEEAKLDAAADLMARAVMKDGLIHLFGTDPHSASAGDAFFFKGGGLQTSISFMIRPFPSPMARIAAVSVKIWTVSLQS